VTIWHTQYQEVCGVFSLVITHSVDLKPSKAIQFSSIGRPITEYPTWYREKFALLSFHRANPGLVCSFTRSCTGDRWR